MNGQGSAENTPEFGGNQFGGGEEEESSVEIGTRGNKRIKAMIPIDWSAELPDSLLIHILSFLSLKEAAITSVLSKRWEFLWADLPRLEFGPGFSEVDPPAEKASNFVSWVNRTLAIRRAKYLEKFDVSFIYHKCFSSDVDSWVQFAVENKVKTLNLQVLGGNDIYTMHQAIYSCPSLTRLHLQGCFMVSKRTIEWQSLTDLYLQVVLVDQHLLDEILSSCPVLKNLYIEVCRGFHRVEVNSPSLHSLSIVDSEHKDAPSLKISAPYLHILNISMPLVGRKLELGNISSVVKVAIDYYNFSWDSLYEEVMSVMSGARELLESVKHVKELYVGLDFIKVVSTIAVSGRPLPPSRRDLLIVTSGSKYEASFPGIMALLESSPNLETFVLEGCATNEDEVLLDGLDDDLADDLVHLKTIVVRNFADSTGEPMLTLARILLERAPTLEEMTIMIEGKDLTEFAEMIQAMLTYPRSSTKAGFIVVLGSF